MTAKKGIDLLRQNFIFYLAGILMIMGLKCYYRQADCDSLLWILAPTAWWVQLLSKIPFTYISGTGYVNHSLRLLIAPSCSGVRFMTIVFATLVFSFVHIIASSQKSPTSESPQHLYARVKGFCWIAASALLSWLFTVFVNGLRIITAIYLPLYLEDAGLMKGMLTQDRLHTMIGVVIYFIALLTIYRLIGRFVQRKPLRKCASPVFWYFILTLGLPFLNRAGNGTADFKEFAVLVTGCCTLVLLPYIIVLFCRKFYLPASREK
ncbi:MAG: exosortase K [Acetatifactor sp.]|nr:exosortase K [Acetatifactor sp.]